MAGAVTGRRLLAGAGAAAALLVAGCASLRVGETEPGTRRATLIGDPAFNAGLPVTVVLRKVDSAAAGPFESRASLSPGPHRVIVDCAVAGTASKARFVLELDAEPGARYRLDAVLAPGNQHCDDVRITPL